MSLSPPNNLPYQQLPNIYDLLGIGGTGYNGPSGVVGPRDVTYPINVNTGEPEPNGRGGHHYGGGGSGSGSGSGGTNQTIDPTTARGFIDLVEAPVSTTAGSAFQLRIHISNRGTAGAKFNAKVTIPSLNVTNDPTASALLYPNQQAVINKTILMPADAQPNQLYPAQIDLYKITDANGTTSSLEDQEVSTIPGPNVSVPPTQTPCPSGQHRDSTGACVPDTPTSCPTGYHRDSVSGLCVQDIQPCPQGYHRDTSTGNCVSDTIPCPTGYTRDAQGNCVADVQPCPQGYHRDTASGNCVADTVPCPSGYHRDTATGNCIADAVQCPSGSHADASGVCVPDVVPCPTGFHRDTQGYCVPDTVACPPGYTRDPTSGFCVQNQCPAHYHLDTAGNCVPDVVPPCDTGMHRNDAGVCVYDDCPTGQHRDTTTGQCVADPVPVVATIVPSATSVTAGDSISIQCNGFGPSEVINFVAKVGTTTVATDAKTTDSTGAIKLNSLTFASSSPAGTATITATGATSGKTATATVTVVVGTPVPSTCPVNTGAQLTVKKIGTRKYNVRWSSSGFKSGEITKITYTNVATGAQFATSSDEVAGSTDSDDITVPTGITCVKIVVKGPKSGKTLTGYFTAA